MAANKKERERALKEVKALIEEAYQFGYFIGYNGHSEWVGWVIDRKNELYGRAEKLGVYELVRDAYRRGKEDGSRKREEDINLGLIEKGKLTEEEVKPKVKVPSVESPSKAEDFEVEFARFLQATKVILPPDFLDTLKALELPGILKLKNE